MSLLHCCCFDPEDGKISGVVGVQGLPENESRGLVAFEDAKPDLSEGSTEFDGRCTLFSPPSTSYATTPASLRHVEQDDASYRHN